MIPLLIEFAKLRNFFVHVPYVRSCLNRHGALRNYMPYMPSCVKLLRAYVPKCLKSPCIHFSHAYVPTTTQDLKTDIYPADLKSDEN